MGGPVPGRTSLVWGSGLAVDVGVERSWRSHVEVFQQLEEWLSLIIIEHNSAFFSQPGLAYFDMAVLEAKRLLVDKSALTGEVHPIAKTPLVNANADLPYDLKVNKSSTVFGGSIILKCGDG